MSNGSINNLKFVEFCPSISIRDIGHRCQFVKAKDGDWVTIAEIDTPPNVLERFVLFSSDFKYMAIHYNFKPYEGGTTNEDGVVPVVCIYRLDKDDMGCKTTVILELNLDTPQSLFHDFYQLCSDLVVDDEQISYVYSSRVYGENNNRHRIKITYTCIRDAVWQHSSSTWLRDPISNDHQHLPPQVNQPKETTMDQATKDKIRHIFLNKGFTIKEGQPDLKPYVYAAAEALLKEFQVKSPTPTTQEMFQEVDHLTPEENALLLDAQTKAQQHQKKVEYYSSLANHLLNKPAE